MINNLYVINKKYSTNKKLNIKNVFIKVVLKLLLLLSYVLMCLNILLKFCNSV